MGQSIRQAAGQAVRPILHPLGRYGGALGCTAIAAAIRIALLPITGVGAPFVLFFGAVLLAGHLFGRGPGIICGLCSACAGTLLLNLGGHYTASQMGAQASLFFVEAIIVTSITEALAHNRRLIELQARALGHSEQRYQLAARATFDIIRDWDMERGSITWNEGVRTMLGYTSPDALGTPEAWMASIHPDDRPGIAAGIAEMFSRRERHWQGHYRFRDAQGAYLHVSDRAYGVYDVAGAPVRLIGAMRNVTRERQAEQDHRATRERLQIVTDALPALIAYLDVDGRFRLINAAFAQWFRRDAQTFVDRTWQEAFGAPAPQAQQDAMARVLRGETVVLEQRDVGRMGAITQHTYLPDRDAAGAHRGTVLLVQDITEARQHERILRESEAHYRVLTEVSPQGTWEATARGAITYTNDYWQQYAGLTAAQSLAFGWTVAVLPEQRRRARAYLRLAMHRSCSFARELQLRRASDGAYRWHLVCGRPVPDALGAVQKWVGVAVDIHDLKRAEADLATAVKARDNFLSTASHELKTPLTSMQLMTQMMRRNHERGRADAYSPAKLTRLFVQIDKSVQRLTRIIDDMLDVSRISSGRLTFSFEEVELGQLLHDVVERLSGQIEASGVEVRVHCDQPLVGSWDKFRLEQVLTNLIINAIRYGEGAAIDIQARGAGQHVCFSVRDHGPGVPERLQGIIFQQFERGSADNPNGGLGLGLFLCREIVERHGGSIGCRSPQGAGAEFVVQLPRVREAAAAG
jgi:PAS domain S-box-containing protein